MPTTKHNNNSHLTPLSNYIVGIGASAGSLEALEQFFEPFPPHSGMTFVVIQHLSPSFKSDMKELLSKKTTIPIKQLEEGMPAEPDCIYLAPPRTLIEVTEGLFHLKQINETDGMHYPIDHFLNSLSKTYKNRCAAIILSGKGKDGSKGIASIYDRGGSVFVQQESTAKFIEMPNHAVETGKVDAMLAPDKMSARLIRVKKSIDSSSNTPEHSKDVDQSEKEIMDDICALIERKSGSDFGDYKPNSLFRRIENRVFMHNLPFNTLLDYKEYLIRHPEELIELQNDLLIIVTEFFRDKEAFEGLATQVIPNLIQQKVEAGEKSVRVWTAGCSTGEEAYSVAMLFAEYLEGEPEFDIGVKIFATDLDREALAKASKGSYTKQALKNVSGKRMQQFFDVNGDHYRVKKSLREMIIFAPHNITKDSPFVNLDLITCRNMLIYFQGKLQQKILSMFHFALQPEGYLFLGPSESLGKLVDWFQPVNSKWKQFSKKEIDKQNVINTMRMKKSIDINVTKEDKRALPYMSPSPHLNLVYETLLMEYTSPCIVVNELNEVIVSAGSVHHLMKVPNGHMTTNILKMVPASLSVAISSALKKSRTEHKEVNYQQINLEIASEKRWVDLTVKPFMLSNIAGAGFSIIMIDEVKEEVGHNESEEMIPYDLESQVHQLINDLENEVNYTKDCLQATIEQLETSNEEYQSTNEELIAANEELQTSNEELQSVNEELGNVNEEHEKKIQELIEVTDDFDNLFISTNIATVFLDEELRVKRFTPAVTKLIHLIQIDIGRPLAHFSHQLYYTNLIEDAKKVLLERRKRQIEISSKDGNWYKVSYHPYRTKENHIKGVVITFVDMTEMKQQTENMLVQSYALEQSPSSILLANEKGEVNYVNQSFEAYTGVERHDILGESIFSLYGDEAKKQLHLAWDRVNRGLRWDGTLTFTDGVNNQKWEKVTFMPIFNEKQQILQFLRMAEDITEKHQTDELLRKSEMLSALGEMAAGIAHEIRNPLTALKGFLQLMQAERTGNEKYLDIMAGEFDRIELIINELLVLARPHAIKYEKKNPTLIVRDVLLLLETQALMNNIVIEDDVDPSLPLVSCVEKELKQVFINILKNGMEAMSSGGKISVSTKIKSRNIQIIFKDQGKGIPEERLEKMGEPFYTTKEKGTGLGLMVSYKIIENHMGKMEFESKVDVGTTVTLSLPIAE
ncbi:CheR family methyltransferase [Alkalihalophilus lindianensis]|uniref:histidine kinase n=1 Tax=Alkalihalophilus lindianensis TaxID=1630542 RepID=A0ABU3XAQ1_9BACI|nr:CheR family methyltransferase [Alkalihalophilus lindianensis]MDV2684950.1 CheR family methyltransferase [Alkalihalophilus lindianensis]